METSPALLVLIGMKNCGKTTVGRLISTKLQVPFQDLDEAVESIFQEQKSYFLSVREIYRNFGKEYFQNLETLALEQICSSSSPPSNPVGTRCAESSFPSLVLALGGGTIENPSALAVLDTKGFFVYLEEEEPILLQRILRGGTPSFLNEQDPEGDFHQLFLRRTALYRDRADLTLPIEGKNPDEVIQMILKFLKDRIELRSPG
jgi:shikimate kinase